MSITESEYKRLKDAEKRLDALQLEFSLAPFMKEFKTSIATVLGETPYEEWPEFAKTILTHMDEKRGYTSSVYFYKQTLPKNKLA